MHNIRHDRHFNHHIERVDLGDSAHERKGERAYHRDYGHERERVNHREDHARERVNHGDYDHDRGRVYHSYEPATAERIHTFNESRRSRDRRERKRRDMAFERRRNEVRLNEEQNTAIQWAYVVDAQRNMRGQVILGRIAHIGPPQRRDPRTKMLESIIIPMRDNEGQEPPSLRKTIVIPFRVFKGKVISDTRWERPYNEDQTDDKFARFVLNSHRLSHYLIFYYLTKIKFLYYITVEYVEHEGKRKIKVTYTHALAYRGPRTISRFMHLLYSQSNRAKDWSLRFHDVASNVGNAYAEPYIMVEIIETLDTLAILRLLVILIAICLGTGASYAAPTKDWSGAFGLASLAIAVLAVVLAVLSLNQYLGMERLIDDDVSEDLGGMYRAHYTDELIRSRGRSV